MSRFEDFNSDGGSIVDDEEFKLRGPLRTSGLPAGFSELPHGCFIYMLVRSGRIVFVSGGQDPWEAALRLKRKYRADRVLYIPAVYSMVEESVAALVESYHPPYNFRSQSIELAELDAILSATNAPNWIAAEN